MNEQTKNQRRADGLATHHQDQLNAMRRDLPKEIMYTEIELKRMLYNKNTGVEFMEEAFWIGGVKMQRYKGKIWVWKNPYYNKKA